MVAVVGGRGLRRPGGRCWCPWDPVPAGRPGRCPRRARCSPPTRSRPPRSSRAGPGVWSWSSLAVSLAVACWLGFSRLGRRLVGSGCRGPGGSGSCSSSPRSPLIGRLATLPFALLLHGHLVDYGLSTQSVGELLVDVREGRGRRHRRHLAGAAGAGRVRPPLARAPGRPSPGECSRRSCWSASFVYPVLVEPLFNDFEPLPDGSLRIADPRARRRGGRGRATTCWSRTRRGVRRR